MSVKTRLSNLIIDAALVAVTYIPNWQHDIKRPKHTSIRHIIAARSAEKGDTCFFSFSVVRIMGVAMSGHETVAKFKCPTFP